MHIAYKTLKYLNFNISTFQSLQLIGIGSTERSDPRESQKYS